MEKKSAFENGYYSTKAKLILGYFLLLVWCFWGLIKIINLV